MTDFYSRLSKSDVALMRMAHGGVQLMNWFSIAAELQCD